MSPSQLAGLPAATIWESGSPSHPPTNGPGILRQSLQGKNRLGACNMSQTIRNNMKHVNTKHTYKFIFGEMPYS